MKLFCIIFLIIILASIVIFLWMLWPAKPTTAMKKQLEGQKYAHRGIYDNKGTAPENSMKAFDNAIKKGYAIELDLRFTKDKNIVIFHDDTLTRMCGVSMAVNTLSLTEIKEFRLLSTEETIPTFKEFLTLVNGRVPLLIEIKSGLTGINDSELCIRIMKYLDPYKGEYVIESFNYAVLEWFKNNRPNVMRGQLSMGFECYVPALGKQGAKAIPIYRRRMLSWLLYNFKSRPHFISYRFQNAGFGVKLCRFLGAMVSVWTVKTPEDSKNLLKQYNAIIFEDFLA